MVTYFRKEELVQNDALMFHTGDVPSRLARSVQWEGVLMPLIATGENEPILLDGYRRSTLLADGDMVPVRMINDRKSALRAAVELNMLTSPYSEMEKAGIVIFAGEKGWMDSREILDTLLPRLGLKGRQTILDSCLALRNLDAGLSQLLAARKAPLKFAAKLSREPVEEQRTLSELFSMQQLSLSRMVQAHDLLAALRKKEDVPFSAILQGVNGSEEDVLAKLKERRFPRTLEIRERLNSLLAPYRGRLGFPEDLEGDSSRYSCVLRSQEDARANGELLRKIAEDDQLFRFLAEHTGND